MSTHTWTWCVDQLPTDSKRYLTIVRAVNVHDGYTTLERYILRWCSREVDWNIYGSELLSNPHYKYEVVAWMDLPDFPKNRE